MTRLIFAIILLFVEKVYNCQAISSGSNSVFIDGEAAARSGDAAGCGWTVAKGGSVNIG
ncbi:MAG: hypothetical protein GY920_05185 [Aliivibrio sp.]|nr:hypothetical protein [Aliivibrio sp.]